MKFKFSLQDIKDIDGINQAVYSYWKAKEDKRLDKLNDKLNKERERLKDKDTKEFDEWMRGVFGGVSGGRIAELLGGILGVGIGVGIARWMESGGMALIMGGAIAGWITGWIAGWIGVGVGIGIGIGIGILGGILGGIVRKGIYKEFIESENKKLASQNIPLKVKCKFPYYSVRVVETETRNTNIAAIKNEEKLEILSQLLEQDISEKKIFFTSRENPLYKYKKNLQKIQARVTDFSAVAEKLPEGEEKRQLLQRCQMMSESIREVGNNLETEHEQTQNMLAAVDALVKKVVSNYEDYLEIQDLNKRMGDVVEIGNSAQVEEELAKLYSGEFSPCVSSIVDYQKDIQETISMTSLDANRVKELIKKQKNLGFQSKSSQK